GKHWSFARHLVATGDFIIHRRCGIMTYVRDDGHIGLDTGGYHFSATKTDFLLDGVDNIEAKGKFNIIFVKPSGHFGNHETADPVVQSPPGIEIAIQIQQLVLEGNHTTDVDAHGFHCLLGTCTHVN